MSIAYDPNRLRNITATDMATLFGLNPYESPAKLVDKKANPSEIASVHLRRGKLREPSVFEAFLLDLRMETVRHTGGTLVLDGYRIAATPDGYVKDERKVVEAKSVLGRNIHKWYKAPPTQYVMQVMTQMLVLDYDLGFLGALEESDPETSEFRFIVWEISRSTELDKMMVEEVQRFWDSVASDKLFRVNSKIKSRAAELLNENIKLIYPTEIPEIKEEEDETAKVQRILSLFNK